MLKILLIFAFYIKTDYTQNDADFYTFYIARSNMKNDAYLYNKNGKCNKNNVDFYIFKQEKGK